MDSPLHITHRPSPALQPWVRQMLWIESTMPRMQMLLPETGHTLMLRQGGHGSVDERPVGDAVLSGLQQQTRLAGHSAHSSFLVVLFSEIGAAAFLHDRADQLYRQTLDLNQVLPGQALDRLQDQLAETSSVPQKFAVLESFLAERITANAIPLSPIAKAARIIHHNNGDVSISALARSVGMSQSALERHFSATVGASPKAFSRIARLRHVCGLWSKGLSLTEIAHSAGYTDQPHLTRDFRAFTGAAPTDFFQSGLPFNLPNSYK